MSAEREKWEKVATTLAIQAFDCAESPDDLARDIADAIEKAVAEECKSREQTILDEQAVSVTLQAEIDRLKVKLEQETKAYRDALEILTSVHAERASLLGKLGECWQFITEAALIFENYARLHEAKDTKEGYKKAKVNMKQANTLRELLARQKGNQ